MGRYKKISQLFSQTYTKFAPELKKQTCQGRARKEESILFFFFFLNKRLHVMNTSYSTFKKEENFKSEKYLFRNPNIKSSGARGSESDFTLDLASAKFWHHIYYL